MSKIDELKKWSDYVSGSAGFASQIVTTGQAANISTFYLTFVLNSGSVANEAVSESSGLTYIPFTGNLTTAIFTGALSGNATSATTATTATNATNLTIITATTGTYYPTFASALTGTLPQLAISSLSFNAATSVLTAT